MKKITNFEKSHEFSKRINELIPAGAHTYSKADDQFPYNAPKGIKRGEGVKVWDVDDNEYIDWTMGLTSVVLGHAYKPVLDAVIEELANGSNFQRPSVVELEFAEKLKTTLKRYDMFKFAKNGSTVTTAAVKLARAYTGKEKIIICGDQPFFSYDDWFIGTTLCPKGTVGNVNETTLKFKYNDIESLKTVIEEHPDSIACLIMEAVKFEEPKEGFLEDVQKLCKDNNIVFILDEMITGFRMDVAGAAEYYGLTPDLATFGKAIGNGFSVAVIAGTEEIMSQGSITEGTERVFLSSTTHGSETHALVAAMKTIDEIEKNNVVDKMWAMGKTIKEEITKLIEQNNLSDYMEIIGLDWLPLMKFYDSEKKDSLAYKTLFLQEILSRGVLFQGMFTQSYMHTREDLDNTLVAFGEAMVVYKEAIEAGSVETYLVGDVIKPVFRKIN